ncbi:MAG: endospore germination permease [Desulfosporosinus sp.]
MLEEGRINGRQLFFIMFWTYMATAILNLPTIITRYAPRDGWDMCILFFIPCAGLMVWISSKLGSMFPEQTFVEYSDLVLGPWLGKFVSALLILWLFHTGVLVYNEVVGLFAVTMLPNTPVPALYILVSLAPAYAVYHGLEVIGRSADFLFFLILGTFLLIYLLLIPEFDFTELLPVFGDGIGNILRSSLTVIAYAGEFIIILFFYPYIRNNQKVAKILVSAIVAVGLGGALTTGSYTLIFGLECHILSLPYYLVSRYASMGRSIERMDPFFMITNFLGSYLKLSIFIYTIVLSLAQLFRMINYRKLIIPVVLALNIFAYYSFRSLMQAVDYLDKIWPLYSLPIEIGIPLLLIIVAKFRGLGYSKKKS